MDAKPPALLSLLGLMLVWPSALSDRLPREHTAGSVTAYIEPGEQRPRVDRSTMVDSCGADHQNYCFNHGQCMLLVGLNQQHCKCERGYYGPRCAHIELVYQPMREEQLVLVAVCVVLLLIGLSGAFYFFYKWYRKNKAPRPQKRQGYVGVSSA